MFAKNQRRSKLSHFVAKTSAATVNRRVARSGSAPVRPRNARAGRDDERNRNLLEEMKSRLPKGWISIFLERWATPEVLAFALPLGEMAPPRLQSETGTERIQQIRSALVE